MRGQRTDRSRGSSGPLAPDEVEALFERGYSLASRRFIAESWGLDPEAESTDVAERINTTEEAQERVESLSKIQRVTLSQVAASGGRMRGENLRRDLLLRGFGDMEDVLRELVEKSILIPLPNPGESELDIEGLLEQDNFLQRDLAVPVPLCESLSGEAEAEGPEAIDKWSGEIEKTRTATVDGVELNLLHFASLLQREPLRLNKSGTPNRRSLARFARGISMPGETGEAAEELDLNDAVQLDYLTFLLALSVELGFVELGEKQIVGSYEGFEEFFTSDVERRNELLINAFQNLRHWNEVESLSLKPGHSRNDAEEHFSYFEATGEPLIGARGYVLSVLRRAQLGEWTPVDAVIDLCAQLDRSYLPRALSKVEPPVEPNEYIEAVLYRALMWTGLVEFGESEDGVELLRFSHRGAQMMGHERATEETDEDDDNGETPKAGECLVVQPNFEVMLFLDPAPLEIVFRLYQIGQREKLSDRVANFGLTAETVQRGFGTGLDAESVIEILEDASHAPVPETVAFQLRDWERVHRKLKLFANGILLRHPDADQLDLIVGQLQHDWRGEDFEIARLGPSAAFIGHDNPPGLERVIGQEDAIVIDYLGEIPPSLYFVDSLEVMLDPMETDIVTLSEIERIGELQEGSTERSKFYKLQVGRIKRRWPEDTLSNVVEFLDKRTEGGIPAAQALRLRSLLEKPIDIEISHNVTVIILENVEIADHFEQIPECEPMIEARLGDLAFAIKTGHEDELDEILEELGIDRS